MPVKFIPSDSANRNYQLAVEIVKAQFPDYIASADVTVDPNSKLPTGFMGQYHVGTARGNKTAAGIQISPKPDPKGFQGYFTTPAVMSTVGTLLHEITHARSDTRTALTDPAGSAKDLGDGRLGNSDSSQVHKFRETLRQIAESLDLPSSGPNSQSPLGEILATILPTLDAKARGIEGLPDQKAVEKIMALDPKIAEWVNKNFMPEKGTVSAPPSAQSFSDQFLGTKITSSDVQRLQSSPIVQSILESITQAQKENNK